jgi:hypothetical protein
MLKVRRQEGQMLALIGRIAAVGTVLLSTGCGLRGYDIVKRSDVRTYVCGFMDDTKLDAEQMLECIPLELYLDRLKVSGLGDGRKL